MPVLAPVLILADQRSEDARPTQATRELVSAARRIGMPALVHCTRLNAVAALAGLVEARSPRAVLLGSGKEWDAIAGALAVRLEAPIVSDVTDISIEQGRLFAIQQTPDGYSRTATELRGTTPVIGIRAGAIRAEDADFIGIEQIHIDSADLARSHPGAKREPRVLRRTAKCETDRELILSDADVVVAGGRGVGSADGFSLLARLAYVLGGSLGGTHTAGELGWCPSHACISLPGAQIHPRLYVAGGVSGSVRHRAAIKGAQTVVAIDRDPNAPILREADFGVVGDLHEVLPALLEELARRAQAGSSPPEPPSTIATFTSATSTVATQPEPSELAEA